MYLDHCRYGVLGDLLGASGWDDRDETVDCNVDFGSSLSDMYARCALDLTRGQ